MKNEVAEKNISLPMPLYVVGHLQLQYFAFNMAVEMLGVLRVGYSMSKII